MTAGGRRVVAFVLLLLLALTNVRESSGSFERLPGPAPGGNGEWVWDWPVRNGDGRGVRVAFGSPAAVQGLGWTHARARASIARWRLEADAYLLALEDLYHETAAGIWCGRGVVTIGARRWDVAWMDDSRRAGWSLSARVASSVSGVDLDLAAQDIPLGRPDASSPVTRLGGGAECRLSPFLRMGGALFHDPSGSGCLARMRWSPIPEVSFRETIRTPGSVLESGIELRARGATIGLWLEPSVDLGTRLGISCAFE